MPCIARVHLRRQDQGRSAGNIKDVIGGYLASLKKHDEPIPPSTEEETVEVPKLAAVSGIEVVKALVKIGYDIEHSKASTSSRL
jgi:hypothetical protein